METEACDSQVADLGGGDQAQYLFTNQEGLTYVR